MTYTMGEPGDWSPEAEEGGELSTDGGAVGAREKMGGGERFEWGLGGGSGATSTEIEVAHPIQAGDGEWEGRGYWSGAGAS